MSSLSGFEGLGVSLPIHNRFQLLLSFRIPWSFPLIRAWRLTFWHAEFGHPKTPSLERRVRL